MVSGEDAMHPMFAELFMKPDEELEAENRRRLRAARRSRQLRTLSRGPRCLRSVPECPGRAKGSVIAPPRE
jgi:hypothetical protein